MLRVVNFHYVRDLPTSKFPRIKGRLLSDFQRQVRWLADAYEMATLESALAFVQGTYHPTRDLCLLTFDDGLMEHAELVTPLLAERRIQGVFFLTTACLEEHRVLSVHKNHFLMASLDFETYRDDVVRVVEENGIEVAPVDMEVAQRTYRFDTPEVASLKYLLNFRLSDASRQLVLNQLFTKHLGDEAAFARSLYLSWEQARDMQAAGMALGGHSHEHIALATLSFEDQARDLERSTRLLRDRLQPQSLWSFSYPYGTPGTAFNDTTVAALRELGYACAFTTVSRPITTGIDPFHLHRFDTTDLPVEGA